MRNQISFASLAGLLLWMFVVAFISFWGMSEPEPPLGVLTLEELNSQMQIPKDNVAQSYQALRQRRAWGETVAVTGDGNDDDVDQGAVTYSLKGVIHQGDVAVALIAVDGLLERYRVGQTLPDGTTLVTISDSKVVVKDKNGHFERFLYQMDAN